MSRAAHLLLSAPGNKNGDARHVGDGAEEVALHELKQPPQAFAMVAEVHRQPELSVRDHKVLQDAKELRRARAIVQQVAADDKVVVWLEAGGDRLGPVESAAVYAAPDLLLKLGIEVQQRVQGLQIGDGDLMHATHRRQNWLGLWCSRNRLDDESVEGQLAKWGMP